MTDFVVQEARWAPVSAGEYDRRTRLLSVNLAVVDAVHARFGHQSATIIAAIVAHERVHAWSTGRALTHEEEVRAREAATAAAGAHVVADIDTVLAEAWA